MKKITLSEMDVTLLLKMIAASQSIVSSVPREIAAAALQSINDERFWKDGVPPQAVQDLVTESITALIEYRDKVAQIAKTAAKNGLAVTEEGQTENDIFSRIATDNSDQQQ